MNEILDRYRTRTLPPIYWIGIHYLLHTTSPLPPGENAPYLDQLTHPYPLCNIKEKKQIMKRCAGRTRKNRRCRKAAVAQQNYCKVHSLRNCTFQLRTIPAGTRLFNGVVSILGEPVAFGYEIASRVKNLRSPVLYLSSDFNTGYSYASGCIVPQAWVREYEVVTELTLADISEDQLYYDADEMEAEGLCRCNGYYLKWSGAKPVEEVAICNADKHLRLVQTFKCSGRGEFEKSAVDRTSKLRSVERPEMRET